MLLLVYAGYLKTSQSINTMMTSFFFPLVVHPHQLGRDELPLWPTMSGLFKPGMSAALHILENVPAGVQSPIGITVKKQINNSVWDPSMGWR